MNIHNVAEAVHNCTSCQMCGAVCPKNAITIELDDEGFYRPKVNENCIDCGLCVKVCYKFDKDIKMSTSADLQRIPLYATSAKDDETVERTTSGGVADLLAEQLLKDGYLCVGVTYNDEMQRAENAVARTREESYAFRGSKYIQSYTVDAFKEVVKNCRNEKYAIFGTPCQIYAMHRYLSMRNLRQNYILIDLYCHGCPSIWAWKKYSNEIKFATGYGKFDRVDFRSKIKGWGNFYVVVVVVEGVPQPIFVSSPKHDEFYSLFFSDKVLNESCHDCKLRSTLAYTDIRLGDFWGNKYATNNRGISAVSLASENGISLFEKISGNLSFCKTHDYSDFLPYQSWGKTYMPDSAVRKAMLASLADKEQPASKAVNIFHRHQGLKGRLKRYVKSIAYYMPIDILKIAKKYI